MRIPFLDGGGVQALADLNFTGNLYGLAGQRFGTPNALPGWTFTRASAKTALDSRGNVISFASGVPAITDLGWLPELAGTNLLLRSTDFSNVAWTLGTGGAISANTIVAPDGTTTASAYTWPSTTSTYAYLSQTVTGNAAQAQAYAVWLKVASGTKKLNLAISDVTTTTSTGPAVTLTTSWQRFPYLVAAAALTNSGSIGVGLKQGAGSTIVPGDIIHVWNQQLEANATASSSDIFTTSAAGTRAIDAASITYSGSPTTATVSYGTSSTATPSAASPLNLGASSGGAWVGKYVRRVIVQ